MSIDWAYCTLSWTDLRLSANLTFTAAPSALSMQARRKFVRSY